MAAAAGQDSSLKNPFCCSRDGCEREQWAVERWNLLDRPTTIAFDDRKVDIQTGSRRRRQTPPVLASIGCSMDLALLHCLHRSVSLQPNAFSGFAVAVART